MNSSWSEKIRNSFMVKPITKDKNENFKNSDEKSLSEKATSKEDTSVKFRIGKVDHKDAYFVIAKFSEKTQYRDGVIDSESNTRARMEMLKRQINANLFDYSTWRHLEFVPSKTEYTNQETVSGALNRLYDEDQIHEKIIEFRKAFENATPFKMSDNHWSYGFNLDGLGFRDPKTYTTRSECQIANSEEFNKKSLTNSDKEEYRLCGKTFDAMQSIYVVTDAILEKQFQQNDPTDIIRPEQITMVYSDLEQDKERPYFAMVAREDSSSLRSIDGYGHSTEEEAQKFINSAREGIYVDIARWYTLKPGTVESDHISSIDRIHEEEHQQSR